MIQGLLRGTGTIAGLCAAIATGPAGCDQTGEGRGDELVTPGQADPCDGLAERVAECADDQRCELDDLQAEFQMCTASGKADGPFDVIEEKIEELKQSLLERAQRCYDDEDASCLWWTYWSLAAGAKIMGLSTASGNMFNFLNCGDDPRMLDDDPVREDLNVIAAEDAFLDQVWCQAVDLAATTPDTTTTISIPGVVIAGDSSDIWYGLGSFTISAEAEVRIVGGRVDRVDMTTTVFDIYDWHAGLAAGGDEEGVSGFQDAWAAWLVSEGEACEFEMGTEWDTTVWDYMPTSCDAQPPGEEPRD